MDGNMLIEFIRNGMAVGSPYLSAVVGALMTTLFLRKNTRTEEFERIKSCKFGEVANKLLNEGKMTYLEYYKCNNFLMIAKKADEYLAAKEFNNNVNSEDYYFDWFVRFYEYASNVSDEEMQKIWAAILEGEIRNPGKTSISLLHALSMMSRNQAKLFCNISRFALRDIDHDLPHLLLFVSSSRDAYKDSGITPSSLKELEHLGLLECDFTSEYVFFSKMIFRTGNNIVTVFGDPNNEYKIKAGNAKFTRDGQLLYAIIDDSFKRFRSEILSFAVRKFIRRNCRIVINDKEIY